MSTKILLIFVCTAVGATCGYMIMRRYRRNLDYLSGVCAVINELKRNIAYRRDGAARVLGSLDVKSVQLKKNIGEYVEFTSSKNDSPQITRGFLSTEVYSRICEMFRSLGRSDGATQIDALDMYASEFGRLCDDAESKYNKYGTLSVKLGFLFGLGVGILIL